MPSKKKLKKSHKTIEELVASILQRMENNKKAFDEYPNKWGILADMDYVGNKLQEIEDWLQEKGEQFIK